VKRKLDKRSIEDILADHADALNRGLATPAALPGRPGEDESLRSLLAVAEWVQEVLVPVQPNPSFTRSLSSTREGRKALTARTRHAALIGAATLGSLLSVVSTVGIIIYLVRHRVRA
jgi:hypothetical protein